RLLRRRLSGRRAAAAPARALRRSGDERQGANPDPPAPGDVMLVARWATTVLRWLDDRLGFSSSVLPVVAHPVPKATNWWYVFGSATLVAFIVQVVTGVALAITYVPAPNSAYDSHNFITHGAILG